MSTARGRRVFRGGPVSDHPRRFTITMIFDPLASGGDAPGPPPIEVRHAFTWTCEECGRDHFGRLVAVELSDEEKRELLAAIGEGVEPWEELPEGEAMAIPQVVECPDCGAAYATESET